MELSDFYALIKECEQLLRSLAPVATGNLRFNGVSVVINGDVARLYIDETQAPYMKYTNEKWKHGKNPNEGWFDRAAEKIAALVAERVQGTPKGELKDD